MFKAAIGSISLICKTDDIAIRVFMSKNRIINKVMMSIPVAAKENLRGLKCPKEVIVLNFNSPIVPIIRKQNLNGFDTKYKRSFHIIHLFKAFFY